MADPVNRKKMPGSAEEQNIILYANVGEHLLKCTLGDACSSNGGSSFLNKYLFLTVFAKSHFVLLNIPQSVNFRTAFD